MNDTTNAVQELLDKQAITELSYRYSRACDRMDSDLLTAVYWPDGTDDHGIFKGDAPAYVDWVMGFLSGWISTHHDNNNILIDLNGDVASGEVHWVGYYRYEVEGVVQDQAQQVHRERHGQQKKSNMQCSGNGCKWRRA